jgi:hypothetical protein
LAKSNSPAIWVVTVRLTSVAGLAMVTVATGILQRRTRSAAPQHLSRDAATATAGHRPRHTLDNPLAQCRVEVMRKAAKRTVDERVEKGSQWKGCHDGADPSQLFRGYVSLFFRGIAENNRHGQKCTQAALPPAVLPEHLARDLRQAVPWLALLAHVTKSDFGYVCRGHAWLSDYWRNHHLVWFEV